MISPVHNNLTGKNRLNGLTPPKKTSFKGFLAYTNKNGIQRMVNTDSIEQATKGIIQYYHEHYNFDAKFWFDKVDIVLKNAPLIEENIGYGQGTRMVPKIFDEIITNMDEFGKTLSDAVKNGYARLNSSSMYSKTNFEGKFHQFADEHLPADVTITDKKNRGGDTQRTVTLNTAQTIDEICKKMKEFEKPFREEYKESFHAEYTAYKAGSIVERKWL